MEALLKASEASALMGVSMRHVRRMAQSGALSYQIHMNAQNRPEYLFPLSSLPDAAQQKYFAEHAPAALPAATPAKAKKADKPAAVCKPLEAYTAEERGEIGYWITTVDRWQTYRNKAGTKKAECDEKFVLLCRMEEPDRQISVETLYRKWAAIREGDYGALVDMRGKARKGMSKMPEAIERVFLSLFLDESQLPVPRCIALTEEWAQQNMPEAMPLPGYHTFYRKAKAVPYPVMVLCRMGEKKYYDLCSPYIRREYESINANDFWVGDTHTLDVESMGPDGTLHRLYLSAWLDARSGIFTGWYVTDSPGSQATLNALRKGILKFGIPSRAYVDNGREFLTRDIGGRGHRAKKRLADGSEPFAPPGVFERLGIEMTNAIVRNARAKLVERRFEDFKNYISRLFPTYTGGNVVEKPNRLKAVLKRGEHIPSTPDVYRVYYAVRHEDGVLHWLGATKGTPEALSAHEEANILWLAGDGPLPPSEAEMQADGTLDFTSGPLAHLKDMLEKVNRHDRRVTVRVPVGGEDKTITLSYRLNGRQETASNAAAGTPRSVNTADIF